MPVSTITGTIKDPAGGAVASVPVICRLMPTGGFRTADGTEVAREVRTTTNAGGVYTLVIERNAGITPANTYYEVTELIPAVNGGPKVWNISVGASDQTVLAALVTPLPAASAGTFLTQASADARYQALGSLGSGVPATIVSDGAGTAGVSTSASRADHNHPIVNDTPASIGTANAEGVSTGFARGDHVHTGAALGSMGYAQVTANQAGITTAVDLAGLAVTFTAVAGRRYKITGHVSNFVRTAGTVTFVELRVSEGAAQLNTVFLAVPNTAGGGSVSHVVAPTPGAHTYKLVSSSDGTVTMQASATSPAFILVEDIGT